MQALPTVCQLVQEPQAAVAIVGYIAVKPMQKTDETRVFFNSSSPKYRFLYDKLTDYIFKQTTN
jgi:hypothetical protein